MSEHKICIECGKPGTFIEKDVKRGGKVYKSIRKTCNACLYKKGKAKQDPNLGAKKVEKTRWNKESLDGRWDPQLDNGGIAFGWAFKHILR